MKILILKPSSLGDVVQALPVLRLLKLHYPKSEIYWWIDARFASLLKDDPDLAGIFTFERKRWSSPLYLNEVLHSIVEMRRHHFDLVIDLQGLARSGAFAWLANGKFLVGVDDPREGAGAFYDVRIPRPSYETHAVDWYLSVLRYLQVPVHDNFTWLPENAYAKAVVQNRWPETSHSIVINPGARWENKRWPAEYYATLTCLLARELPQHRFVLMGSKDDASLAAEIIKVCPERCIDLTGRTSLSEMVEWLRLSDLVVTNDTGPMHVAAALGKPLVALFGPTDYRRTGPYGQFQNVIRTALPCAPCMKGTCHYVKPVECLRAISPELVKRHVIARLNS